MCGTTTHFFSSFETDVSFFLRHVGVVQVPLNETFSLQSPYVHFLTSKMGGDDLGSDDEFLTAPIIADPGDDSSVGGESVENTSKPMAEKRVAPELSSKEANTSKKRRKVGGDALRELGSNVKDLPLETQSKLLSDFAGTSFLPHHMTRLNDDDASIAKRIQGLVSKKKLKKWKEKESPCVIIICISARRAVQVLKEIAPLNVRAAKLFAKHITIEDQIKQLQESPFGIAVGTPHRILTLATQGALSLQKTQSVVLDTFLNDKKYSVFTLPDTVPHVQDFLRTHVQPECQNRKDLRVGFV